MCKQRTEEQRRPKISQFPLGHAPYAVPAMGRMRERALSGKMMRLSRAPKKMRRCFVTHLLPPIFPLLYTTSLPSCLEIGAQPPPGSRSALGEIQLVFRARRVLFSVFPQQYHRKFFFCHTHTHTHIYSPIYTSAYIYRNRNRNWNCSVVESKPILLCSV